MRKTAFVLILIVSIVLSLSSIESQTATILVKGNAFFGSGYIRIDREPVVIDGVTYDFPENKTCYSSTITFNYSAFFPSGFGSESLHRRWIFYSLDGGENVTLYDEYNDLVVYYGSVTLSGLSSGNHIVDIYSIDGTYELTRGWLDATDRAYYTIVLSGKSPTPKPTVAPTPTVTPTPTAAPETISQSGTFAAALIFVASVGIALGGVGLFVYFKKQKGA